MARPVAPATFTLNFEAVSLCRSCRIAKPADPDTPSLTSFTFESGALASKLHLIAWHDTVSFWARSFLFIYYSRDVLELSTCVS